ncbi:MAG: tetratricopeptide repeat protein [Bacteroidetes bacterium]|nr:tetratricopeptide repeat protein [Bacteroidota bacterium]
MKWLTLILMSVMLTGYALYGQRTPYFSEDEKHFRLAIELYEKEKYSAARIELAKVIESKRYVPEQLRVNAKFYNAVCAYELYHRDAEKLLLQYMVDHPSETRVSTACFYTGLLYYREKKWKSAADYFDKTEVADLSGEQVSEFYFKSGYCYFMKADYLKAAAAFRQITNGGSKYTNAAKYYFAYISYLNKNYETALEQFANLKGTEPFALSVMNHIVNIHYMLGKYDLAISAGNEALQTPGFQNTTDIKHLMAESYYRKGDYKDAAEWLEKYQQASKTLTRDDLYKLGYSYYKGENFASAIVNFQKVVNLNDTMAQNAYYHLGDCFLKTKNKQSARNAFQFASKQNFVPEITQDALYNFGKLSFELGFQPQAINTFMEYQKKYPGSKNNNECNEYLAQLYLQTKNYKEALSLLEKIKENNPRMQQAYQKVAYYRANELYNDGDYPKAIALYEKAIVNNVDASLASNAIYWKAEALYKQQKYPDAIKQFRTFVFYPSAVSLSNYSNALYDLGYCHFKTKNWAEASDWFRKYLNNKMSADDSRSSDAMVRIADAAFILNNYPVAIEYYTAAIKNNSNASDYCLFQRGMIDGINDNHEIKIFTMQNLVENYPNSTYLDDAMYECGDAYFVNTDNQNALIQFNKLIDSKKESSYKTKALLKKGLIYFNQGENKVAYNTFKTVVESNPKSQESMEALMQMKNISVKEGNPDAFIAFMNELPLPKASDGVQDTLYFETAQNFIEKQDYPKALESLSSYLQKYPNGVFAREATYYKAECLVKENKLEEALPLYEKILAGNKSGFTERSLFRAAAIHFKNKNYSKSLEQFSLLEQIAEYKDNIIAAYAGQMRSCYYLDNYDGAITAAQKLLKTEKLSPELGNEAHLIYARCAVAREDYAAAQREYAEVEKIGNSERAAEAKYHLALIQHLQKNYKEAEKLAYVVINQVPSYDFWIAKSFILLGDNYYMQRDTFQAKSTLKSVLDNYKAAADDKEDILKIANEKYQFIINQENNIFRKEDNDTIEFDSDSVSTDGQQ